MGLIVTLFRFVVSE